MLLDERDELRASNADLAGRLKRAHRRTHAARLMAATWRLRALQGRRLGRATPRKRG